MPHSTALPLASGKSFFFFPSELPSCFFFFFILILYICIGFWPSVLFNAFGLGPNETQHLA